MSKVDRAFYKHWIVANGWSEAIGLGSTFIIGYLVAPLLEAQESLTAIFLGLLAAVILGTLLEGVLVGLAQEQVLRSRVPEGFPRYNWTRATAIGACLAWFLGMIPSSLVAVFNTDAPSAPAIEPAATVQYGLALILGIVLGPILGSAQARVLRGFTRNARKWLWANAAAWGLGMALIFAGMDLVPWKSNTLAIIAAVLSLCCITGLAVGTIHGRFLISLVPTGTPPQNSQHDTR